MLTRHLAWVFDLDGTLTVHQHDFDAIRAELGIPQDRLILEYLATLPPAAAAPLHARLAAIEAELAHAARAARGAARLLEMLRRRGCRLGILTRNTRTNALATLAAAGLADYFARDDVLGRDEAAPKPSPRGILDLIGRWRCTADAALMVGDYRLDLEAGRNAGVTTVHVAAAGAPTWPDLTDVHVQSLDELAPHLAHAEGPGTA
ncbi:MAG: HAD family hydrolase [Gammaproteobacteria bacterium]|nr:HAD family hydrolase [Gammaproteobacteria bacterium]